MKYFFRKNLLQHTTKLADNMKNLTLNIAALNINLTTKPTPCTLKLIERSASTVDYHNVGMLSYWHFLISIEILLFPSKGRRLSEIIRIFPDGDPPVNDVQLSFLIT